MNPTKDTWRVAMRLLAACVLLLSLLLGGCGPPATTAPLVSDELRPDEVRALANGTAAQYLVRAKFSSDELRAIRGYIENGQDLLTIPVDLDRIHAEFVDKLHARWRPLLSEVAWRLILTRKFHLPKLLQQGKQELVRSYLAAASQGVMDALDQRITGGTPILDQDRTQAR